MKTNIPTKTILSSIALTLIASSLTPRPKLMKVKALKFMSRLATIKLHM